MESQPTLFPLRVMARRLFVPMRWLREEAENGRVPHLRAGRHLLFDPETVERVLLERAQQNQENSDVQKCATP